MLGGVDLAVSQGEFVALIGPSGCGKSTLLRLVAGLERPAGGSVRVGGEAPVPGRADTAFLFQEPTLLPWLTVAGNVALPLRLEGVPRAERERVAGAAIGRVGLAGAAAYYPRQLSGGMKMRAALARALTRSPGLLLLDEPFGALDEMARNRLNEELLAVRAQAEWTALFVTHSVAEAVFLSSRIVVLAGAPGRVADDLEVPFPYPRGAELRESADYQRLVGEVLQRLREAGAATETGEGEAKP